MRIAFVVDKFGWIQHDRSKLLQSILPFDIDIYRSGDRIRVNKYDCLYFLNLSLLAKNKIKHPFIVSSITSHKTLHRETFVSETERCRRCSVNSRILYNLLIKNFPEIIYIPNGVDIDFFSFSNKIVGNIPVLGWVGNRDRKTKRYDIVKKLIKDKIKIKTVATSKSKGKIFSTKEMFLFYHSIDYFFVCSDGEGTPNPALEAASCGVPLISTKVGNMPEIIIDGENGFFLDDDYNKIKEKIEFIISTVNAEKHWGMKRSIRKRIEENWSWRLRKNLYIDFFNNYAN